jgi:ubiquinone/menaquinone biosynthesis C-methylase UbiE
MGLTTGEDMQGLKVLDLACGTGEISRMLCSLGADVTGLDFSETMHCVAKVKLKGQIWQPLLCDAENLAIVADNSFDFATTRHLAWSLTDPAAAYAEWFRVLKPGGRLLINDGDWTRPFSLSYQIKRWIAHLFGSSAPRSA